MQLINYRSKWFHKTHICKTAHHIVR